MRTVTSPPCTGSVAASMGSTTTLVALAGSAADAVVQSSSNNAELRSSPLAVSPTLTLKLSVLVAPAPTDWPVHTTRRVPLS